MLAQNSTTFGTMTFADAQLMAAEQVINYLRFVDITDRTLAFYGDDVDALFPSAEDLAERGFNLVSLAHAFESGLEPATFADALENVSSRRLKAVLAGDSSGEDLNTGLYHLVHSTGGHRTEMQRALCLVGECNGCCRRCR